MLRPLLFALALAVPAAAETRQFGDTLYAPFEGWREGRQAEAGLIHLADLPGDRCEFCYLHLGPSVPLDAALPRIARREAARFVDEEDRGGFQTMGDPTLLTMAGRPAAMIGGRTANDVWITVAVDTGHGRAALIGFEGHARDPEDGRESLETFRDQLAPQLEGLRFAAPGEGLLPAARPGPIEGVMWGWDDRLTIDPLSGAAGLRIEHEVLVFWRDGHFYHGTPPRGLAPLDRRALLAALDRDFGTYRAGRNAIELLYASGRTEILRRGPEGWNMDGTALNPVSALPDGARIAGRLSSFSHSQFAPGSGMEGGVASSSETRFDLSGRWTGRAFGGASAAFDGGGGFATMDEGGGSGRYAVRGGLIVMTAPDGTTTAELILQTPDGILIGDRLLEDGP